VRSRVAPTIAVAVLVAAAVAAAITLNVLLLGRASAQNGPAGRLTPRLKVPPAPAWTVRPATGPVEDRGADD
jgi:hypothetical protein